MALNDYTQRIKRESEFHDRWALTTDPRTVLVDETFTKITGIENQYILKRFGDVRGKRVLDYGCGAAEGGIYLAKLGAEVVGMDVSAGMLKTAEALATHHGVKIETRLVTDHRIPADRGEFDFVYGNGVLHHVDLACARPELARIMAPSGMGCFIEPLTYNPVIEVYRRMAQTMRTDDERPLKFKDIEAFSEHFGSVDHREFWLLTLGLFFKFLIIDRAHPAKERYWKKVYTDADRVAWFFGPLSRADEVLLSAVPALGRLCWNTVITVAGPKHTPASVMKDERALA